MIDTFLFDFDGTIANTIPGILITLDKTRDAMNCDYDLDFAKSLIGTPLTAMGTKLCGAKRSHEFVDTYRREYIKWGADKISYYDGIEAMLSFLKELDLATAVVTSKRKDSLLNNLDVLKGHDYFDILVAKESTDFFKPHPAPVEYALTALNAQPGQAVMIGDTHYDIECGKGAGVTAIGVTWGIESKKELLRAHPEHIAETPQELTAILKNLMK